MTETPATVTPPASARPPLGLVLGSLLRADATTVLRNRYSGLLSIALPIVIVIVDTYAKGPKRLGSASLVVGLALILGLGTSSLLGYTLTLSHDRDAGVLRRLRVAPVPGWTIMASRLAVQLVLNLIGSIVVIMVAAILQGLHLSTGRYLLLVAVAALGGVTFLCLGQAVAGIFSSATVVLAVSRFLFVVLILVGLLGFSGVLGDTMETVSLWTPVGALITLFSNILGGNGWAAQDGWAVLACIAWIVVAGCVGIRWFRWESNN